ncbi:hypothetical protein Hanom_Chr11g01056901 [Helianthus anomalus]
METDGEGGGESEEEGDRLHGESVDCEELHGENNNIQGAANTSQFPTHLEHACEKTQPQFDLNKSIGSFLVGSTKVDSVNRSRKRCRSPSQEEFGGPEGQRDGPNFNQNPLHDLIKKSKVRRYLSSQKLSADLTWQKIPRADPHSWGQDMSRNRWSV